MDATSDRETLIQVQCKFHLMNNLRFVLQKRVQEYYLNTIGVNPMKTYEVSGYENVRVGTVI